MVEVTETKGAVTVAEFVKMIAGGVTVGTTVLRSSIPLVRTCVREYSRRAGLNVQEGATEGSRCGILVKAIDHCRLYGTDIDAL